MEIKVNKPASVIHIAIAFDQNYVTPFYALTTSLIKNHSKNFLQLHAITTGISENKKAFLKDIVESNGFKLSFYKIDMQLVSKFVLLSKWTSAAYYKLFFPLLISENIERIIYLDTDTIVVNNLFDLYTTDLEGFPLAAVYDNYVKVQPLLNIHAEGEYFNSGVMLIDIKKWREQNITERVIDYVLTYPERIKFVDQCGLNGVLHRNWKRIEEKYNLLYSYVPATLSKNDIPHFLSDKLVVHFTLQRPWNMLCKNRLRDLYFENLNKSLFLKSKVKYTDFAMKKIPAWLAIRVTEFYFDHPLLQSTWRKIKLLVNE